MADKTITDLNPLVTPASTDVLAIVDVASNETKKIEVGNLVGGGGGGEKMIHTAGGRIFVYTTNYGPTQWKVNGSFYSWGYYVWSQNHTGTLSNDPPVEGTDTLSIPERLFGTSGWYSPYSGTLKMYGVMNWENVGGGLQGEDLNLVVLKLPASGMDGTFNGNVDATVVMSGTIPVPNAASANVSPTHYAFTGASVNAGDQLAIAVRFPNRTTAWTANQYITHNFQSYIA